MNYFLLFILAFVCAVAAPQHARADVQVSLRSQVELGIRKYEADVPGTPRRSDFLFGGGLRGDAMYGWPRPKSFRIGPAFEFRTMNLETLEGAIGLGVLIPMPADMPIGLTGLIGSATRKGNDIPDGLVGIGTFTWGYRNYNHDSWYGYAISLFGSGRKQIGYDMVEWTGGVELDFVFTAVIPGAAMMNYMKNGDPYEE